MDQTNKKVISVSFLITGALTAYVLTVIIGLLQASVSFFARLAENDIVTHGIPVVVGIAVFLFLQFNPKTIQWADDVISEIRKMVWRTMKDTTAVTIAVCIMVIVSGILLGFLDYLSSKAINYLISL